MQSSASAHVNRFLLAAVSMAAALLTGCSYPKAIHTYEYLVRYDRMTGAFDPLVSLVYAAPGRRLADYSVLFVDDIGVAESRVEDVAEAALYALRFRCTLRSELAALKKFRLVTLDRHYASARQPGILRLAGKVTVFDKGSGWQRYLLGRGAADFQVECRITDMRSGEVVMELADRRGHLGNTPFGPNPKTFSNDYVMKAAIKQTAVCMAQFIGKAFYGLHSPDDSTVPADPSR